MIPFVRRVEGAVRASASAEDDCRCALCQEETASPLVLCRKILRGQVPSSFKLISQDQRLTRCLSAVAWLCTYRLRLRNSDFFNQLSEWLCRDEDLLGFFKQLSGQTSVWLPSPVSDKGLEVDLSDWLGLIIDLPDYVISNSQVENDSILLQRNLYTAYIGGCLLLVFKRANYTLHKEFGEFFKRVVYRASAKAFIRWFVIDMILSQCCVSKVITLAEENCKCKALTNLLKKYLEHQVSLQDYANSLVFNSELDVTFRRSVLSSLLAAVNHLCSEDLTGQLGKKAISTLLTFPQSDEDDRSFGFEELLRQAKILKPDWESYAPLYQQVASAMVLEHNKASKQLQLAWQSLLKNWNLSATVGWYSSATSIVFAILLTSFMVEARKMRESSNLLAEIGYSMAADVRQGIEGRLLSDNHEVHLSGVAVAMAMMLGQISQTPPKDVSTMVDNLKDMTNLLENSTGAGVVYFGQILESELAEFKINLPTIKRKKKKSAPLTFEELAVMHATAVGPETQTKSYRESSGENTLAQSTSPITSKRVDEKKKSAEGTSAPVLEIPGARAALLEAPRTLRQCQEHLLGRGSWNNPPPLSQQLYIAADDDSEGETGDGVKNASAMQKYWRVRRALLSIEEIVKSRKDPEAAEVSQSLMSTLVKLKDEFSMQDFSTQVQKALTILIITFPDRAASQLQLMIFDEALALFQRLLLLKALRETLKGSQSSLGNTGPVFIKSLIRAFNVYYKTESGRSIIEDATTTALPQDAESTCPDSFSQYIVADFLHTLALLVEATPNSPELVSLGTSIVHIADVFLSARDPLMRMMPDWKTFCGALDAEVPWYLRTLHSVAENDSDDCARKFAQMALAEVKKLSDAEEQSLLGSLKRP